MPLCMSHPPSSIWTQAVPASTSLRASSAARPNPFAPVPAAPYSSFRAGEIGRPSASRSRLNTSLRVETTIARAFS